MAQELEMDPKDMMEALSAQRNEALNAQAVWFARYMTVAKELEALKKEKVTEPVTLEAVR